MGAGSQEAGYFVIKLPDYPTRQLYTSLFTGAVAVYSFAGSNPGGCPAGRERQSVYPQRLPGCR